MICTARMASAGLNGRIDTTMGPANGPDGRAGDVGAVHRHPHIALDVADRQVVRHQRFLERERAAEHEGDEIVAPMRHDIGRLLHHLAVTPDPVARHVGADIEIDPERGNAGVADVGHADDRTRFGIELAEPVKRRRELFRQDREIALDEAVGDAGRGRRHAGAAGQPRLQARQHLRFAVDCPALSSPDRQSPTALHASTGGAAEFYHARPRYAPTAFPEG